MQRNRGLLLGRRDAPFVPCQACDGNGFTWRRDPAGELEDYPARCRQCPNFNALHSAARVRIVRWENDSQRRIAAREAARQGNLLAGAPAGDRHGG